MSPGGIFVWISLTLALFSGTSKGEMLLSVYEGFSLRAAVVYSQRIQEVNCSAPASARQCFLQVCKSTAQCVQVNVKDCVSQRQKCKSTAKMLRVFMEEGKPVNKMKTLYIYIYAI